MPVAKGQHLAVDTTKSIAAVYNSNGSKFSYVFSPPLVEGTGARGSTEAANELMVAATIEPDADKDGFGDETQDQCPRQATTQGPCDDTKPGVTGFKVKGGKASYNLSEAATVSLLLEKKIPGRKVGEEMRQADAEEQNQEALLEIQEDRRRLRRHRQRRRQQGDAAEREEAEAGLLPADADRARRGRQRNHGDDDLHRQEEEKEEIGKRRTGIEPASSAWKAEALPLSYRRAGA